MDVHCSGSLHVEWLLTGRQTEHVIVRRGACPWWLPANTPTLELSADSGE